MSKTHPSCCLCSQEQVRWELGQELAQAQRCSANTDGLQGHVQLRISWESPSQQRSLDEEGLDERGPKDKRSEVGGVWEQMNGMQRRKFRGSL